MDSTRDQTINNTKPAPYSYYHRNTKCSNSNRNRTHQVYTAGEILWQSVTLCHRQVDDSKDSYIAYQLTSGDLNIDGKVITRLRLDESQYDMETASLEYLERLHRHQ